MSVEVAHEMSVEVARTLPVVDLTRKAAIGRHVVNVDTRKAAIGRHVVNVDGRNTIDCSYADISQPPSHEGNLEPSRNESSVKPF